MRILVVLIAALSLPAQTANQLRFALRVDPKTFNPLLAADEASESVRYLTGGVLIRLNRLTQALDPELATSWKVSEGNRRIDFQLRPNVRFSDGTPFSCEDVAYTVKQLMDPALHSPAGDSFRTGPGLADVKCSGPVTAMIRFPAPIAALDAQFDQVAILSSKSPKKEAAVLGPFEVAEYKAGTSLLLRRNPNYWKSDPHGAKLPYLDSIRLDIQQNRETEVLRFRRGETDLVNKLDPELFDQLAADMPKAVVDAGPSLDWELVFFNQVAAAPIEDYKKAWFRSSAFRHAISEAINRPDLCRIVYRGHARPASGPVSPSNRFWANPSVQPHPYSTASALKRLAGEGFRLSNGTLLDKSGHPVEFSMITNAGSKVHDRMMTLIQQDLAKIGVKLNVTALDFPSLIERISRSYRYESCLMAFANIDLDPNGQMNIWPSTAANHQWNPSERTPATPWEAEIDRLMTQQNEATSPAKRKAAFDRVQEIIAAEAPMLFLVHPDMLAAVSPRVGNAKPSLLTPQLFWNAEKLTILKR